VKAEGVGVGRSPEIEAREFGAGDLSYECEGFRAGKWL
jgi:hypothetical protein